MKVMRFGLLACLLLVVLGSTGCYSTPDSGEIGVVRNGRAWYNPFDWFDNRNIRQTVPNGSGASWVGMGSDVHYYPVDSQQRFFRMESCFDEGDEKPCKGADATAITVPTADGVEVRLSGIFYLNTGFASSPQGEKLLEDFDTQFATRTFDGKHAFDGTKGWSAFLAAIVEPVIVNNMRQTVAGVTCSELVSSCALVQNTGDVRGSEQAQQLATGKVNQDNVKKIQDSINANLATDIRSTLGQDYFKNIQFRLGKVALPGKVQGAIDQAQAAFAEVSQAQAQVRRAQLEADANERRQAGYRNCPTCARIDALKALPRGLQALGGNVALGLK